MKTQPISQSNTLLDNVTTANPCSDKMTGDDKVRYCRQCRLNVYNLSAMTRREAEDFLRNSEGRTCLAYCRRADGTIMTQDCRSGKRRIRRGIAWFTGACLVMSLFGLSLWFNFRLETGNGRAGQYESSILQQGVFADLRQYQPAKAFFDWIDPPPPPPVWLGW